MTIKIKSLSGATMISCFFERTLKNVISLEGSKSLTTLRALSANWLINPAYCTVVVLSRVDLTGIPKENLLKVQTFFFYFSFYLHCLQQRLLQHLYGIADVLEFLLLLGTVIIFYFVSFYNF